MFERLTAPGHVIFVRLSGKVTGEDIQKYETILEDTLQKHDRIGICVDFTGLSDMSADALIEGVRADLELFAHITQFSRYALVSDKEWPRAMINFIAPVFPNAELKAFTPEQIDQAVSWAAQIPKPPKAAPPAARFVPTNRDDVLAFEVNGVLSSDEFPAIIDRITTAFARHDKIRMLNRIRHLGGFDPRILMQSGFISMKIAALQQVERYAIVGAPPWMSKLVETINPAFPDIDVRVFAPEREAEAWDWIDAKPAE